MISHLLYLSGDRWLIEWNHLTSLVTVTNEDITLLLLVATQGHDIQLFDTSKNCGRYPFYSLFKGYH